MINAYRIFLKMFFWSNGSFFEVTATIGTYIIQRLNASIAECTFKATYHSFSAIEGQKFITTLAASLYLQHERK